MASITEAIESLTGFEEIAITKNFDGDVFTLLNTGKETMATRSLIFIAYKRNGMNDVEAKKAALGLTLKQVNDYFEEAAEELFPDSPITEEGKDA